MKKYVIKDIKKVHISKQEIDKLYNIKPDKQIFIKPFGLYYSKGLEWVNFAVENLPEKIKI